MMRTRQDGFTLLELLVSMTLLGLVFILLFGGLRFGTRAWEHGSTETDATDSVRLTQAFLRAQIERTCPRRIYSTVGTQTEPRVDFVGSPQRIFFQAPAPQALAATGCTRMTLSAEPEGGLQTLSLKIAAADGSWLTTALLRGALAIDFSYLGAPGTPWQANWSGAGNLPALIRLRAVFPNGDKRVWPELFVAPRVSAEADCVYDPATKSCRGR